VGFALVITDIISHSTVNFTLKKVKTMVVKKRRKSLAKIESKAISNILNFEKTYRNYKKLMKQFGKIAKSKEEFYQDWIKNQTSKIENIQKVITHFNDKAAPLKSNVCLEFRRLLAQRRQLVNPENFSDTLTRHQWHIFYNHSSQCDSCCMYQNLHKWDDLPEQEFREVSQKEFEAGLDEFFKATKKQADSFEEMEEREGLKDIPVELVKHLSSEYAKAET
jgi:hypothetical protein